MKLPMDNDNGEEVAIEQLRKSLNPKLEDEIDKQQKEAQAEPIDQFAKGMEDGLENYKTNLSRCTNVENLISHLSMKYLAKYAQNDPKAGMSSEMMDFAAKHPDFNLKTQLEAIRHQIASELFNISKVVDDGSFHVVLSKGQEQELKLNKGIPACCKINLEDMCPPLNIRVTFDSDKERRNNNLSVFASYKAIEPKEDNHDMSWVPFKRHVIPIPGERGPKPNIKVFPGNTLYITFKSQMGATINVRPIFSEVQGRVGPKPSAEGQPNPARQELLAGLSEGREMPAQKTMISDFVNHQLNFKDMMMMISETRKKDNEGFGKNIVMAAQAVRDRRDNERPKKDFLVEHQVRVRHWHVSKQEDQLMRRMHTEAKKQ